MRPNSAFAPHTPVRTKLSANHPRVESVYSNLLHNYEKLHHARRASLRSGSLGVTALTSTSAAPTPIKELTLRMPHSTPLTHPAFLSNRNVTPQRNRPPSHKRRQSLPYRATQHLHLPSTPHLYHLVYSEHHRAR